MKWTSFKKRNYLWATLALFVLSFSLHWIFGWKAYKNEQAEKGLPVKKGEYITEAVRDTMENWQSEFLQLIWQVAGLAILYCVGSPSSKEGDDRKEEKLDFLLKKMYPDDSEKILKDLNKKYPKS
jgi:hypothetical protein